MCLATWPLGQQIVFAWLPWMMVLKAENHLFCKLTTNLKQDFVAFINYETQLDSLRQPRKKTVTREFVL